MKTITFKKGDVIFRQGDPGESILEVYTGKVGVYSHFGTPEQELLMDYFPDGYFGEMGLLDHAPRSATAVAMENNTCVGVVTEADFGEFFRENPTRILMIMQQLSHNLRKRTKAYMEVCTRIHEHAMKEGQK